MQNIEPGELLEMVEEKSLVEVVLYYWLGRWAEENERQILEEMMVLVVDHGEGPPSAVATIEAAKGGKGLLESVAAGAATINASHGGAIEGCAKLLVGDLGAEEIVREALDEGRKLPGFGHRIYRDEDPRVTHLEARSQELGFRGKYFERAREIEAELEKQKGKKLVLNIDGGMAAVMCELKVEPGLMNGFFLWPRIAGLIYRAKINLK